MEKMFSHNQVIQGFDVENVTDIPLPFKNSVLMTVTPVQGLQEDVW